MYNHSKEQVNEFFNRVPHSTASRKHKAIVNAIMDTIIVDDYIREVGGVSLYDCRKGERVGEINGLIFYGTIPSLIEFTNRNEFPEEGEQCSTYLDSETGNHYKYDRGFYIVSRNDLIVFNREVVITPTPEWEAGGRDGVIFMGGYNTEIIVKSIKENGVGIRSGWVELLFDSIDLAAIVSRLLANRRSIGTALCRQLPENKKLIVGDTYHLLQGFNETGRMLNTQLCQVVSIDQFEVCEKEVKDSVVMSLDTGLVFRVHSSELYTDLELVEYLDKGDDWTMSRDRPELNPFFKKVIDHLNEIYSPSKGERHA